MGQEKYRSADIQIWRNEENITPSIDNYDGQDFRWKIEDLTEGNYEAKFRPQTTDLASESGIGYGITVCNFRVPPFLNKDDSDENIIKQFDMSIREGKPETRVKLKDKNGADIPPEDIEWVKLGGIYQDTENEEGGESITGEYAIKDVPYGEHMLLVKTSNAELQPYYRQNLAIDSQSASDEFEIEIPPAMTLIFYLFLSGSSIAGQPVAVEDYHIDSRDNTDVYFFQKESAPDSNGNPFWKRFLNWEHTADGRYRIHNAGDGEIGIRFKSGTNIFTASINNRYTDTDDGYREMEVDLGEQFDYTDGGFPDSNLILLL